MRAVLDDFHAGFHFRFRPFVAGLAGRILDVRRRRGVAAENDVRLRLLGTLAVGVRVALAVAGRAGRGARVSLRSVHRATDPQQLGIRRFVVAGRALRIPLEHEILRDRGTCRSGQQANGRHHQRQQRAFAN